MNGDDEFGFADGNPVPQVPFVYPPDDEEASRLVQLIHETPDDQLVPMLEAAFEKARKEGYVAGRKDGMASMRGGIFRHVLGGDPTPLQAWRRLYRLAFWYDALPDCDTHEKLARKIDCTRQAIGPQLAIEIPKFERETGTPVKP